MKKKFRIQIADCRLVAAAVALLLNCGSAAAQVLAGGGFAAGGGVTAGGSGGGGSTLLTGLSLYVKFNESSGNAADSSGNGFTLVNNGTVTYVAGKIGNAANFVSGSSQYFLLADNATISTADNDFEGSMWVYIADKAAHRVFFQKGWDVGYAEQLVFYNTGSDRFVFQMGNASGSVTANTFGVPAVTTWYHLNWSYTASTDTMRIAVNGTADTATWAGGNAGSDGDLKLGLAFGTYLSGRIDALMFWSQRNLTGAERTEVYNGGTGVEP